MADDARESRLIELWTGLAERVREFDSARGQWLQDRILQPFQSNSGTKARDWIEQAGVISDWLADSAKRLPSAAVTAAELQKLRGDSGELIRRIEAAQQAERSRLLGLLNPAKDLQPLLDELRSYLGRCQAAFGSLDSIAQTLESKNQIAQMEKQIDDHVAQLAGSWPPIALVRFQASLRDRVGEFLPYLRKIAACSFAEWRNALSELHEEPRDVLVLLRGLLEALAECPNCWSDLAILARELLTPFKMQAELIRDANQPADWFEEVINSEVAEPKIERPGLAIRPIGGAWSCFPKGRLIVPLPPPEIEGFAELEEIAREAGQSCFERLRQWREANRNGALETTAVQFYVDWWAELGDESRQHNPDLAAEIANHLQFVLQHGFGLFPFSPGAFQDYPDGWIQRLGDRPMVTGRVRRVVRPGLQDDQNHLRVPAVVEVE